MTVENAQHLILIDGSGFIFRAFHALPPMTRPDGTPVNAVFGFTNMLGRLLKDHVGTHIAVIFDAGRRTFRNDFYPAYKAQRPPPPPDLVPQFALTREATDAFGVKAVELEGFEADDLIATYARVAVEAGARVTIISSDKDLMQLVRPGVDMLDAMKQKTIGPAEVLERFGVPPDKVVEVQALMGDAIDNVPGVPGIGAKGAASLIQEYGDLEAVLAAAPGMKPSKRRDALIAHADAARLSHRLVTLDENAPLPCPLDDLRARDFDAARLSAFLAAQGFKSVAARLGINGANGKAAAPVPALAGAPVASASRTASVASAPPDAPYGPYETITTLAALRRWIAKAHAAGIVALDTETDSLDAIRAQMVGFSLATAPGRACYVPLRHGGTDLLAEKPAQLGVDEAMATMAPLLADPAVLKVLHNAKYDLLVLAQPQNGGCTVTPIDDTMLISYMLDAGRHGHGMDELSALHLGHTPISYDEVTGTGKARISFAQVALDRASAYAAEDTDVTLRLWQVLKPRLRPAQVLALYEQIERRLIPVLMAMEQAGVKVDAAELAAMSADFAARMATIEAEIHRLAGRSFNVASPKQLGEILFDEMGLPGGKRMKTGAWGTDASVLEGLAEQGHELPSQILAWRQLAKLKSTYADALVEQINPASGRVHTSFAMALTTTGRLSSSDPNLQNIPIRTEEGARIRRAFIAEPGNVLVSADYSQIELRLLAHVADVPTLRQAFIDGEDIHARTASEVFGVPMAGMDPLVRRQAKAVNFGIIYGISAFGLARQLGVEAGEAKRYIDAYFARYPGIRAYMEAAKEQARIHGYVLTPFGRRCWVPGIADKNAARRAYAERQAINAPLQGGAADIIKRAMVRLPAALAAAGVEARMLLQVHDELLFEAPQNQVPLLTETVRHVMEHAETLSVPLTVEIGTGKDWSTAH